MGERVVLSAAFPCLKLVAALFHIPTSVWSDLNLYSTRHRELWKHTIWYSSPSTRSDSAIARLRECSWQTEGREAFLSRFPNRDWRCMRPLNAPERQTASAPPVLQSIRPSSALSNWHTLHQVWNRLHSFNPSEYHDKIIPSNRRLAR